MSQNIYDDETFFNNYAKLPRSMIGLQGAPEFEYLKSLLPPITNESKIVDLGCGYGWFCREAIKMGAKSVLGIDISKKMINRAEELDTTLDLGNQSFSFSKLIKYEIQDLEKLQFSINENDNNEQRFDLAYSVFVFHYLLDLEGFLRKIYSSLKKGGTLLFTVEHPIFSCSKYTNYWIDYQNDTEKKIWPVSHYSYEGERVSNWLAEGVKKQHRTIGTYINTLINTGFTISHVNEWSPTDQQIKDNPSLLIEKERPMILIIKAIKN
ncbi:hypothetical protein RB653_007780 [Dictyostelium firmibasis]|uniref:Methyltransferase type 11 domain-containing protein n=1 Tax=Dictyostelium firmibasis TaxID=79012 RepID=A0AAN7YRT3_9MYCE